MKVEKIYFEELFSTGQFQNQRLGMEIILEESAAYQDNAIKAAYAYAKLMVEESFKSLNPSLTPTLSDFNSGIETVQQVEKVEIGDLASQIKSVTDLKVLESYKLLVKGKQDLEKLYLEKLEELS